MSTEIRNPILVVIQLTGGNDYVNTIVPYANSTYYDNRANLCVPAEQVLPIDDEGDGFASGIAEGLSEGLSEPLAMLNSKRDRDPTNQRCRASTPVAKNGSM